MEGDHQAGSPSGLTPMTTEFLQRHRAGVLMLVFLAVSSLLLVLRIEPYIVGIKTALWFMVSPEVVYTGQFFNKFDTLRGRLFHMVQSEGENFILREQLAAMAKRDLERDTLENENNRLRDLLGLRQKMFAEAIPAEVVGRDVRDWFHTILINKGSRDGIAPSAAVVVGSIQRPILVGRIGEVEERSSKVLLVTDLVSAVSVRVVGRADLGLLAGGNRPTCIMKYLSRQSEAAAGDEVVTAGLGGVFPPGIPVGVITDVNVSEDGFFKFAKVRPHSDFGSLLEVLVLQRKEMPLKEKAL